MTATRSLLTAQESNKTPGPSGPAGRPKKSRFELAMMTPAIILLVIISVIPFLTLIVMSFSDVKTLGGISFEFVGLKNWIDVLGDGSVWESWGRSLVFFVSIVALQLVLGFAFALVLNAVVRGRSIMLSIVLIPMFFAPVIVGLMSRFLLDSTIGLYAQLFRMLGVSADFFSDPSKAFPTLVLVDTWQWTPLITLILLAGLTSVPQSTLEAATLDGAGYFRKLFRVILPQMKSILLVALLIRSMDAIRYYDIITATTNGGPADTTKIVPLKLYEFAFRFNGQMGNAAVLGLTMLAFSILLANFFVHIFEDRERRGLVGGDR